MANYRKISRGPDRLTPVEQKEEEEGFGKFLIQYFGWLLRFVFVVAFFLWVEAKGCGEFEPETVDIRTAPIV